MFHVGQRVVCVRDEPPAGSPKVLQRDAEYTISRVYPEMDAKGEYGVEVAEVDTPAVALHLRAFEASRFRPIVETNASARASRAR